MVGSFLREHRGERGVFRGEGGFGFDFSVAAASSVAVVSLAMIGDPAGIKQDPHRIIR